MLTRLIERSLTRRRRSKVLGVVAVALGITVATIVGTMALDVGDKVSHELRSFGANITVTPAADSLPVEVGGVDYRPATTGAFLAESDLAQMKRIFWRNNIVAFAPYLYLPASVQGHRLVLIGTWFDHALNVDKVEVFHTGIKDLHPAWRVRGRWPGEDEPSACLVGQRLAQALGVGPGDSLRAQIAATGAAVSNFEFRIAGILETGGSEDNQIFAPLETIQRLSSEPGKVRRVEVSALTKPEDDFARRDPARMTPEEYERWSCSPYVRSIAHQIEQAIPGSQAKPVFRVADTEGKILKRIGALMTLLAGAALITAVLAVASVMLASVFERRAEIGLFKSLGASSARVAAIFLLEASAIGLAGGVAGYFAGSALAWQIARSVFGTPADIHWVMLPVALVLALVVAWAGSALPVLRGLKTPAATALRN